MSHRLRERGHEVVELADAQAAMAAIDADPTGVLVTDLAMPGVSGLQLCRLVRADPRTAHLVVVLLTATDDRRARFWATQSGATAYVTKTELGRLLDLLDELGDAASTPPPASAPRAAGSLQERLSALLDDALFETTIAAEVRRLAEAAQDRARVFAGLAAVASDVAEYRWMALRVGERLFVHAPPEARDVAIAEAARELGLPTSRRAPRGVEEDPLVLLLDDRAVAARGVAAPIVERVVGADAALALAPSRRGASRQDVRLLGILGAELSALLRIAALADASERLATSDALTGLANRRAFEARIARARARDGRLLPLSVLVIDVDHFKRVNDTHGHDAGDAVLARVAGTLVGLARRGDVVARWGGEEFVVALAQTADVGARVVAERLRRALEAKEIPLPAGGALHVTASFGVASTDDAAFDLDELVTRADRALYAAKHRGRNRVEIG